MQQRDNQNRLSQEYTNRVLLNGTLSTPRWWYPLVSVLLFFVVIVLFNNPQFGIGVMFLLFVFIPLYFKFSSKTQSNYSILKLK